jgi:hypothetical protein
MTGALVTMDRDEAEAWLTRRIEVARKRSIKLAQQAQ